MLNFYFVDRIYRPRIKRPVQKSLNNGINNFVKLISMHVHIIIILYCIAVCGIRSNSHDEKQCSLFIDMAI